MQFPAKATVVGAKHFKGEIEGKTFDSTKVFVLTDMDTTNGNAIGQGVAEYNFGDSTNFQRYMRDLAYPCECEMMMEMVTTGKRQTMRIVSLKPANQPKAG